jgi:hypothetical protein
MVRSLPKEDIMEYEEVCYTREAALENAIKNEKGVLLP